MSKRNNRDLLDRLLESRELEALVTLLKKEDKKEEKKEEHKKKSLSGVQIALISMLLFPISGPLVLLIWKISGKLIQLIVNM